MNNKITEKQKQEILKLKKQGLTNRQIGKMLNVAANTVLYWYNTNYRNKYQKRKNLPLNEKINRFSAKSKTDRKAPRSFSVDDLRNKIGPNPKCYLTNRPINIANSSVFQLDHIISRKNGGDNSLENCGLSCADANAAKNGMYLNDFIQLCKEVCENFGYQVMKLNSPSQS